MRWVRFLDWFNRKCKGLCVRLGPHPKHRLTDGWHCWYLKHLALHDVVLDYGCGSGRHADVAETVADYVARYDHETRRMASSCRLPEQWSGYTAILLLDVLQLVPDRPALLKKLYDMLTENGRLFIALPYADTTWRRRLRASGLDGHYEAGAVKNYTLSEMDGELYRAGFRVIHFEPTVYDTPWAGLIDLIGQVCWPLYHVLMRWKRRRVMANWSESTGFRLVCVKSS